LDDTRNHGNDLVEFIKFMNEKHSSPQLINVNTTAV
jgi:hypothetical protein